MLKVGVGRVDVAIIVVQNRQRCRRVEFLNLGEYGSTPLVWKDESALVCTMLWVLFVGSGLEAAVAWTQRRQVNPNSIWQ